MPEPDFFTAWEVTSPESPKEELTVLLMATYRSLHDLLGPFKLRRIDPLPHSREREDIFYLIDYRQNLSIRQDGHYDGPESICFYGPGGIGHTLTDSIMNAAQQIKNFRGCLVTVPPEGIYGPVYAPAGVSLYGEPRPEIKNEDKLQLAMAHVIGRIPMNWPLNSKLEQT